MLRLKFTFRTAVLVTGIFSSIPLLSSCCAPLVVSGAATSAIMAADRRTSGTIVDDKGIEIKAFHALSNNSELWKKAHITAVSYNNVLLLVGQAPTEDLKLAAEHAVDNIAKVRTVYNEITIAEPISIKQRGHDTWISTQMKARLVSSKDIHPTQVKVITENGTLYLMGILTPAEEEEAIRLAKNIKGVDSIIKMFETVEK
jgi:osmotically-inducible protein OsmY